MACICEDALLDYGLPRKRKTSSMTRMIDHRQFEQEGAALVELVDHEAIEILGGLQLLR